MKGGIYEGLSFEDYKAIDAFNQSGCLELFKCPAKYWYKRNKQKTTKSMDFGNLVHISLLEPHLLEQKVQVMPDLTQGILTKKGLPSKTPKNSDEYRARVAKFYADNPNVMIVEHEELEKLVSIKNNLSDYPEIQWFFKEKGKEELTLVWECPDTGILCKARIDKALLNPNKKAYYLVDIKTAYDADASTFSYESGKRGYHVQSAHYLDGAKALGFASENCEFAHVVLENQAPHLIASYQLDDDDIELGRLLVKRAKQIYARCKEQDDFPAYPDGIRPISLKKTSRDWFQTQLELTQEYGEL